MKKVKQVVLDRINNPASRNRLGLVLKCDSASIAVQIRRNKVNGRLTKMDALEAISAEAKVAVNMILEDVTPKKVKVGA